MRQRLRAVELSNPSFRVLTTWLDKMVYGLTNPCAAHLVDKVHHWPGVRSHDHMLAGRPMKAQRPCES